MDDESSKAEDDGLSADQLVPDYAAGLVIYLKTFLYHSTLPAIPPFFFVCLMFDSVWPIGRVQECVRWKASDNLAHT